MSKINRVEDIDNEIILEIASAINLAPADIVDAVMKGDFEGIDSPPSLE